MANPFYNSVFGQPPDPHAFEDDLPDYRYGAGAGGNPYYPGGDFNPEQSMVQDDVTDIPVGELAGQARILPTAPGLTPDMGMGETPPQEGAPPGSDSQGYNKILQDYLGALQKPVDFPQPTPLTKFQALAVILNPEKREQMLSQFQGQPYERKLAEMQFNQQRQGQAATIASRLAERQQEMERHDREQSWFRESAMANSGTSAIPPGYVWKNEELRALWEQKTHDKQQADRRTDEYLARGTRSKPTNKFQHLDDVRDRRDRAERGLNSFFQSDPTGVMRQMNPNVDTMYSRLTQSLSDLDAEESFVAAMDDQDYQEFSKKDGVTQAKMIAQYTEELRKRGIQPRPVPGGAPSPTPLR